MSDQYLIAHVGQNTGLKQPVKTIRNNHQMRFI